jgi:lipopolysaccharide export system permease protein
MAVLGGILIGFGRLAGDREFVALQACGVSLARLIRPVAIIAIVATGATAYETIVALPQGNQSFREITFGVRRHAWRAASSPASSSRTSPTA